MHTRVDPGDDPRQRRAEDRSRDAAGQAGVPSATIGVAPMFHIEDVYFVAVLIDPVPDPVLAASRSPQALEGCAQWCTDTPRLVA